MKCWPEATITEIEDFHYPAVGAPPSISWEAFADTAMSEGGTTSEEHGAPATPETNQAAAIEAHATELRHSFESGRERGIEEGRAAEREVCAALMKAQDSRQIKDAGRLLESFSIQQARYFETVEREVVKLALAIAARILRREAEMDPLLLSGAVRVALGQLSASAPARLRVPAADLELWRETIAHLPNLPVKPLVVASEDMSPGQCILETELGSVDLGISSQLSEIERGFFDSTGPDRERNEAIRIKEDRSE
jgi:flagellar assembly protein FliH